MEERHWFGSFGSSILLKYSLEPVREFRDNGEFALDFRNADLGLRLLHDHYGSDILVTPADDADDQYALELVLKYLTGRPITSSSLDELADTFEENYEDVVQLFARQPLSRWNDFRAWLEDLNRTRFGYDQVRKEQD